MIKILLYLYMFIFIHLFACVSLLCLCLEYMCFAESTKQVLKLSLAEFSLPKFYQLFGISKVKSASVSAFRTSYRPGDRSFAMLQPDDDKMPLSSLEAITDALLEIMEVGIVFFI